MATRKYHARESVDSEDQDDDWDIWVPYGVTSDIAKRDLIYCVGIERGRLLFFGRVLVESFDPDDYNDHQLNVWAVPDSKRRFYYDASDCAVNDEVADGIEYLKVDGSLQHIRRDERGWLLGNAFQGAASLRELVGGYAALDRDVEAR
jgi:hypothetical protein